MRLHVVDMRNLHKVTTHRDIKYKARDLLIDPNLLFGVTL